MKNRKKRRSFSREFKKQVVDLYHSGKARKDIIETFDLTPSAFDKWVKEYTESQSKEGSDELSPEKKELLYLREENAKLQRENDILKQAALIFGRMDKNSKK